MDICVSVGFLRNAWRTAFTDELVEVLPVTYAYSLLGYPHFETVYVDHNPANIMVSLGFANALEVLKARVGTVTALANQGAARKFYEKSMFLLQLSESVAYSTNICSIV